MPTWTDTAILIRDSGRRPKAVQQLLYQLFSCAAAGAHLVAIPPAGGGKFPDLINVLMYAARLRHSWILLLEDDVWPAPVFPKMVPGLLDECKTPILSLFARRLMGEPGNFHGVRRGNLNGTLCMCYRQGVIDETFWEALEAYRMSERHKDPGTDNGTGIWAIQRGYRVSGFHPSLVQHREGPSLVGHRKPNRISPSFLQFFGAAPPLPPEDE